MENQDDKQILDDIPAKIADADEETLKKIRADIEERIRIGEADLYDFYTREYLLNRAKDECARRNGGTGVCWYCGGHLCWNSDFNYDEVFGEGEGIASTLTCLDCGAEALFSIRHDKEEEE